jgi:hypothetical protein
MARETYIWDRHLKKVVPKDEYLARDTGSRSRVIVIRDIDPYRSAAAEKHTGKRPIIGGRRQHREFLKRNGYVEMGSETPRNNLQYGPRPGDVARDIKRALGE